VFCPKSMTLSPSDSSNYNMEPIFTKKQMLVFITLKVKIVKSNFEALPGGFEQFGPPTFYSAALPLPDGVPGICYMGR
jgi:hypothetical protein